MKKMIFMFLSVCLLASCEKDPDMDEMDGDFTVYTQYDSDFDFSGASTYYLADSILVAGQGLKGEYWKDENAQTLISRVANEMNQRGYVRASDKESADVGLQMTYVETSVNMTTFVGGFWDGWWNPGYWGPYWGGGWYMSFPVSYSYDTGAIVLELVDLGSAEQNDISRNQLPIIWRANSEGLLSSSSRVNMILVERAISQSFEQSPYINHE